MVTNPWKCCEEDLNQIILCLRPPKQKALQLIICSEDGTSNQDTIEKSGFCFSKGQLHWTSEEVTQINVFGGRKTDFTK